MLDNFYRPDIALVLYIAITAWYSSKLHPTFRVFYQQSFDNMCKVVHLQWWTLHEILGGGGASARGLVRFIGPCHGRGFRGHAPPGKF